MTAILIIEGNTPGCVSRGISGARPFVDTLARLHPAVQTRVAAPYAMPVAVGDLGGIDGVIFTGSAEPWSVDAAQAAPQRAALELVLQAGLPVWGSCNGMQLAALVLGGAVGASENGLEMGMARDIWITTAGQYHPMLAGRMPGYAAPCVHRDEVTRLPDCMTLLAGNDHSPVQAVAVETDGMCIWGTQYHPELSLAGVAAYLRDTGGIFHEHGPLIDMIDLVARAPDRAGLLGCGADDLAFDARASELGAWIARVAPAQPLSPVAAMGYEQREPSFNPQQAHEIHAFLAETPSGHDRDA